MWYFSYMLNNISKRLNYNMNYKSSPILDTQNIEMKWNNMKFSTFVVQSSIDLIPDDGVLNIVTSYIKICSQNPAPSIAICTT